MMPWPNRTDCGQRARSPQAKVAALDAVLALLQADARSWAAQLRGTAELEVAGSWRVGQLTASRLMYEADRMAQALPHTLSLLAEGALLVHQAKVLLHDTGNSRARARPAGRN